MRVLPRSFSLTVAFLYAVIGFDSRNVPLFPYWVWPVAFTAVALGIVHMTFRPDAYKLRLITAIGAGAGTLRGFAFMVEDQRFGPVAAWLLISMLGTAYYLARRDFLPEHYGDDHHLK